MLKKTLSLLLAMAITLSLTLTAFAADVTGTDPSGLAYLTDGQTAQNNIAAELAAGRKVTVTAGAGTLIFKNSVSTGALSVSGGDVTLEMADKMSLSVPLELKAGSLTLKSGLFPSGVKMGGGKIAVKGAATLGNNPNTAIGLQITGDFDTVTVENGGTLSGNTACLDVAAGVTRGSIEIDGILISVPGGAGLVNRGSIGRVVFKGNAVVANLDENMSSGLNNMGQIETLEIDGMWRTGAACVINGEGAGIGSILMGGSLKASGAAGVCFKNLGMVPGGLVLKGYAFGKSAGFSIANTCPVTVDMGTVESDKTALSVTGKDQTIELRHEGSVEGAPAMDLGGTKTTVKIGDGFGYIIGDVKNAKYTALPVPKLAIASEAPGNPSGKPLEVEILATDSKDVPLQDLEVGLYYGVALVIDDTTGVDGKLHFTAYPSENTDVEARALSVSLVDEAKNTIRTSAVSNVLKLKLTKVAPPMFSDVPEAHWAYIDILQAIQFDVLNPDAGKFKPDDRATRYDFVKWCVDTFSLEKKNSTVPAFTDLSGMSAEVRAYVTIAWQNGVFNGEKYTAANGKSALKANLNGTLTREQYVVMIVRTLLGQDCEAKLKAMSAKGEITAATFPDAAKTSSWAKLHVDYAQKQALVKGNSKGYLNPQSLTTRAEAIAVLMRAL